MVIMASRFVYLTQAVTCVHIPECPWTMGPWELKLIPNSKPGTHRPKPSLIMETSHNHLKLHLTYIWAFECSQTNALCKLNQTSREHSKGIHTLRTKVVEIPSFSVWMMVPSLFFWLDPLYIQMPRGHPQ